MVFVISAVRNLIARCLNEFRIWSTIECDLSLFFLVANVLEIGRLILSAYLISDTYLLLLRCAYGRGDGIYVR